MSTKRPIWLLPVLKIVGITLLLALLARIPVVNDLLRLDELKKFAFSLGWRGAAPLVIVGALAPLAFIPRWPFAVLFGMAYGTAWGIVLASVSGLLGAVIQYLTAAALVSRRERAALERLSWFRAMKEAKSPALILLAIRLFPLSNFTVTNLVCGLLHIRFSSYVAASALGMLPATAVYVLAGHGAASSCYKTTLWALAVATLLVPITMLLRRTRVSAGFDDAADA